MDIVKYHPGLAEPMYALYNQTIELVVHCYPVSTAVFTEALEPVLHTQSSGLKNMRSQYCLAAMEGETLTGFAHAGVRVNDADRVEGGAIRFLTFEPGNRSYGQLLLDRVESILTDAGATSIVAFHQRFLLPFYHHSPAYLSDRIGHVRALFAMANYEKCEGEVFLDRRLVESQDPAPMGQDLEVRTEKAPSQGVLPGLKNSAWIDGKEVGQCCIISSAETQRCEEVEDRGFMDWLGVEEPWQGKGVGKFLLQQTLNDSYALGYRRMGISTAWDNHRAFVFYSNFGFEVSDWTYGWSKKL